MTALGGLGGAVLSVKSLGDIRTSPSFAITYFTVQDHPGLFFIHRALDTISHCSMCLPYMIFVGWMWFTHCWKNCISTSWYSSPRQSYFAQPECYIISWILLMFLIIEFMYYTFVCMIQFYQVNKTFAQKFTDHSWSNWSECYPCFDGFISTEAVLGKNTAVQSLRGKEGVFPQKRELMTLSKPEKGTFLLAKMEGIPESQSKWWYLSAGLRGFLTPSEEDMVSLGKTRALPTDWEAKRVSLGKQRKLTTFSLSEARGEGIYYSKRQIGHLLTSREKLPHSQRQRG